MLGSNDGLTCESSSFLNVYMNMETDEPDCLEEPSTRTDRWRVWCFDTDAR